MSGIGGAPVLELLWQLPSSGGPSQGAIAELVPGTRTRWWEQWRQALLVAAAAPEGSAPPLQVLDLLAMPSQALPWQGPKMRTVTVSNYKERPSQNQSSKSASLRDSIPPSLSFPSIA